VAAELASQRQAEINAAEASRAAVPGKIFEVTVERIEHFGVFVTWPGGGRGLVPLAELGLRSASAVRRRVPVGTVFEAMVTESVAGRVRLSKAEAEKAREQQEAKAYLDKQKGQMNRRDEPDLGSFGALLKAKLEGKG
jgi:ribosomal protein S1